VTFEALFSTVSLVTLYVQLTRDLLAIAKFLVLIKQAYNIRWEIISTRTSGVFRIYVRRDEAP